MEQVGRYQLIEQIGEGGMAVVYRAQDNSLKRNVALKLLADHLEKQESVLERFTQEAQIIAQLEHPHIVPIYDVGSYKDRPYLVMRLLRGGTLRDKLNKTALQPSELWPIAAQVALALDSAHKHGVIHRDVKPSNILFDDYSTAYVSDFGVAKMANATTRITRHNKVVGTPAYMSPEQWTEGQIDGSSDQYSLAVVLFEALSGQRPFTGNTIQIMYKHTHEPPPDLHTLKPSIAPAVTPVMQRALAKRPFDRFKNVTAFVTALQHAATTSPTPVYSKEDVEQKITIVEPQNPHYEKGQKAMSRGSWRLAIAAFKQVQPEDPFFHQAISQQRDAEEKLRIIPKPKPPDLQPPNPNSPPQPEPNHFPEIDEKQSKSVALANKKWWLIGVIGLIIVLFFLVNINRIIQPTVTLVSPTTTPTETLEITVPPEITTEPESPNTEVLVIEAGENARWQVGGVSLLAQIEDSLSAPGNGIPLNIRTGNDSMILELPDKSVLFLAAETEVNIENIAGSHDVQETFIEIVTGSLVINPSDSIIVIKNRLESQVQTTNAILGVTDHQQPLRFEAACLLHGSCVVTGDLGGTVELVAGEASFVGGSGNPETPRPAKFEQYGWANVVPTPTITPTPTNTPKATATPTKKPTFIPPSSTPTVTSIPSSTPTPGDVDLDGVPDNVDKCPGEYGPKDRQGCPRGKSINNETATPSYPGPR